MKVFPPSQGISADTGMVPILKVPDSSDLRVRGWEDGG